MAFENNQQDAFDLRNNTESLKQWQVNVDKATTAIGAAEVAAEKELAELKLANLEALQKEKLKKLDKLLDEEYAGIELLAEARLRLSDKQFKVRKKQIQDELQLLKDAVDELHKVEDKKSKNTDISDKDTKDSSSAKVAAKVTSDKTEISELIDSAKLLNKTFSDLRTTINTLSQPHQKGSSEDKSIVPSAVEGLKETGTGNQTNKTTSGGDSSNNNTGIGGEDTSRGNEYTSDAGKMRAVDLGRFSGEDVLKLFDANREHMDSSISSIFNAFNKVDKDGKVVTDKNGNAVPEFTGSQVTLDFAGELLESIERTEDTKRKIDEFNANRELNLKLSLAKKEQDAKLGYLTEYQQLQTDGFNHLTENMTAAEFEALRAETAAIEKEIENRGKLSTASQKALDTLRGKGTAKEKKALLEAQVKQRIAEKDWSKYGEKFQMKKITDDMSDDEKAKAQKENEEAQKRRENATKAEMAVNAAMGALANLAQKLNQQTDKIGAKQTPIDTRLQGSTANEKIVGSYWKRLAREMNYVGAVNPYFTQEDFANNIETLVNKGISFDIKQRAFLMTIQEKIANTFDVADGTLLRLIRIQQQDTTAGRLGMESALNSFLNSMYETSEYLTDVAASVRSSLFEMQAFESGDVAAELEFQVQKWMGSLYSVGMSQDAVQGIAQAFGQIASGDVSGLTGNGSGNLLIMAANEAGLSIADILQEGLDAKETNELMQAMVNYLAEIAETSSDSRVVQQQLANVYGVKASDLKAATNLASSIKDVSNQDLTYSGMLGQLKNMANSMGLRTSTGEMLSNVWSNVQYTMATTMANDPMLYLLPRVATLLEDYAGGIDLPFINAMGFGVDLNTSVAQLMNVAAVSIPILNSLGPMLTGLTSAVSGSAMLSLAGINTSGKTPVLARGTPAVLQNVSGSSISESGQIVGNSSGDDIKKQTLQGAEDDKKKMMVEAKDEESSVDFAARANQAVIDIYSLLEEVAHGSQSLRVRVVNSNAGGGILGSTSGAGTTGAVSGEGGADNGNWVLSF